MSIEEIQELLEEVTTYGGRPLKTTDSFLAADVLELAEVAAALLVVAEAARRLRDPVNGRASDLFAALDALDALP